MKGLVVVAVGVCLVALASVFVAIPSTKPIAFPTSVPTAKQPRDLGLPIAVKLSRDRVGRTTIDVAANSRGGRSLGAGSTSAEGFVGFSRTTTTASARRSAPVTKPSGLPSGASASMP